MKSFLFYFYFLLMLKYIIDLSHLALPEKSIALHAENQDPRFAFSSHCKYNNMLSAVQESPHSIQSSAGSIYQS